MGTPKKAETMYTVYMLDRTQDKQFHRVNLMRGCYVKRGEQTPTYGEGELMTLRNYIQKVHAANPALCFEVRNVSTGTVIFSAT